MFVIAEAGSNWRMGTPARDLAMARALIDVAREAGADAVKFQTFRAATMTANPTDELRDLEMPYDMIPRLAEMCEGIEFMSSAFSVTDAKAVDPYVKRHKVASPEITHLPLLRYLAATGKPVILSCGAAVPGAIDAALDILGDYVTLLQCTSKYPASDIDLMAMGTLAGYGVPVGLSDHSLDPIVGPVGAVVLGASVIEKHFTLSRRLPGPDHSFALEPAELKEMVRAIHAAEQAIGVPLPRRVLPRCVHGLRDCCEQLPIPAPYQP